MTITITDRLKELNRELEGARYCADWRAHHGLYTEAQLWAEYAGRLQADWVAEARANKVVP